MVLSYDFNLSELTAVSSEVGGFEVMLGYEIDLRENSTRGHSVRFN
jgi:hypothetical protein